MGPRLVGIHAWAVAPALERHLCKNARARILGMLHLTIGWIEPWNQKETGIRDHIKNQECCTATLQGTRILHPSSSLMCLAHICHSAGFLHSLWEEGREQATHEPRNQEPALPPAIFECCILSAQMLYRKAELCGKRMPCHGCGFFHPTCQRSSHHVPDEAR